MTRERDWSSGLRSGLLRLAPGLAATWAAFWGLVTWNVLADTAGPGAVIGAIFTVMAAVLPAAVLIRRKRTSAERLPVREVSVPLPPEQQKLLAAFEQVKGLVAAGMIDRTVIRGLDDRIDELGRLLAADVSNQELGGQPSGRLQQHVAKLADLLVGVADAALDRHSAALDSDDRAATSLREALGQMRAEEEGYRELEELNDKGEP